MSARSLVAAVGCGLLLAGCQTLGFKPAPIEPDAPPPPVADSQTPTVSPPDPGPPTPTGAAKARCVPRNLPRAPRYPDTDAALRDAGGAADRYQLMAAGRLLRMRRLADLEKIIEDCR